MSYHTHLVDENTTPIKTEACDGEIRECREHLEGHCMRLQPEGSLGCDRLDKIREWHQVERGWKAVVAGITIDAAFQDWLVEHREEVLLSMKKTFMVWLTRR